MPTWARAALAAAIALQPAAAYAQGAEVFDVRTSNSAYTDGDPLLVYGTAFPGDPLVIRLFAPDGSIKAFEQAAAAADGGSFSKVVTVWPEPSIEFPYGTYTVEVFSTIHDGMVETVDVAFGPGRDGGEAPPRSLDVLVYAPESAAVGSEVRVFVQVTSDGLLVSGAPADLLSASHAHRPDGGLDDLSDGFRRLHSGLYYADYAPSGLGTHVFHAVALHKGTVAHGSAATSVAEQDIGGISVQIVELDKVLGETAADLERLESEVAEFGAALERADSSIGRSVGAMAGSVRNIEEASLQLNSLLFPIMAMIGITVAIQIAILARHR